MTTTVAPPSPAVARPDRIRSAVHAVGMVGSPLLFVGYWLLYPAYGDLHAADIAADLGAAPARAELAEVFGFAGAFLALPAALGFLHALADRAPRLSRIGAGLGVVGWSAVLPLLLVEGLIARELSDEPERFHTIYTSPTVDVISGIAVLHVVGGVLIGVALLRARLVPAPLAGAFALAPMVHLLANLAGLLWLDVATWLVLATTAVAVLRRGPLPRD